MTQSEIHRDSVEFGLAQLIWESASDELTRTRAVQLYEIACNKNDGAAWLAMYTKYDSYSAYLEKSMKLGYSPAFFYAGEHGNYSMYERLVYVSIGMFLSFRNQSPELNAFQQLFLNLSNKFAHELIPEILLKGEEWQPGDSIGVSDSKLEGQLITHPKKYDLESDIKRDGWAIFEDCENTESYLKLLPGSTEYFKACEAEDNGDMSIWKLEIEMAQAKGNGQAIYALKDSYDDTNLFLAAQSGSIDAFLDLIDNLHNYFETDYDFYNTTRIKSKEEDKFLAAINCFLYLFTIMQRLGISKYCNSYIDVARLTSQNEYGYEFGEHATSEELKYELCSHKLACQMNDRAYKWKLTDKFDSIFFENYAIVTKA
jgi:hypothetical protein